MAGGVTFEVDAEEVGVAVGQRGEGQHLVEGGAADGAVAVEAVVQVGAFDETRAAGQEGGHAAPAAGVSAHAVQEQHRNGQPGVGEVHLRPDIHGGDQQREGKGADESGFEWQAEVVGHQDNIKRLPVSGLSPRWPAVGARPAPYLHGMAFVKLDAAGTDFIALDVRSRGADWRPDSRDALLWCDRRHGVGADGILLLGPGAEGLDYHLTFLNPDGSEAFCGNGARAAFAWWRSLMGTDGHLPEDARFSAVDGRHEGHWVEDEPCVDLHVKATPVDTPHGAFVHTGTEHLVLGAAPEDLAGLDLIGLAEPIRQHPDFAPHGVNVNVVATAPGPDGRYAMRTFEKGVEGETLSCGSGTVAAAAVLRWQNGGDAFSFAPPGGKLGVVFEGTGRAWLSGPVEMPFKGTILPS